MEKESAKIMSIEQLSEEFKRMHITTPRTEKDSWSTVGLLRLDGINKESCLTGVRPVFELIDLEQKVLFDRLLQSGAPIKLIKMQKNEHNQYLDDQRFGPKLGAGRPFEKAKMIVEVLMKESLDYFQSVFAIGDMFRVEPAFLLDHRSGLKTDDDSKEQEQIHVSIEKRAMEKEVLEAIVEKRTRCYETMRYKLNDNQTKALMMALNEDRKLVCIGGPPGTGKTQVLAMLIAKLMQKSRRDVVHRRAIVLTATNEALSNLIVMTKMMMRQMRVPLHEHELMDRETFIKIWEECPEHKEFAEKSAEWEELVTSGIWSQKQFNEKRDLENTMYFVKMQEVMKNVRLVFSTISSKFVEHATKDESFQNAICIIDEAAQMKDTEIWPSVLQNSRIVLAGDLLSLPALTLVPGALNFNITDSVMSRIMAKKEQYSCILFKEQYRSRSEIMEWGKSCFYDNNILNCSYAAKLQDLMKIRPESKLWKLFDPMVLVDTSYETGEMRSKKTFEQPNHNNTTFYNIREAEIVKEHYLNLLNRGIPTEEMAIITPYKGQKKYIEDLFREYIHKKQPINLEFSMINIGSVDVFQGQEFTVVIFSLVRSNPKLKLKGAAYLSSLNVAITRAKCHFMLIGNGIMLKKCRKAEIVNLYKIFENKECRFPPSFVFGKVTEYVMDSERTNFGQDLFDFAQHCKSWADGGEMYNYCVKYMKRRDELVWEKRERAQRQLEQKRH